MQRPYAHIISKLRNGDIDYFVEEIGIATSSPSNYPIYMVRVGDLKKVPVLLSGGVHGDEPAGVYALLDFLENEVWEYINNFCFFVYPCVNPSGFEFNTRYNANGFNLNREFKEDTTAQETDAILKSLKKGPKRYIFTLDMHEFPEFSDSIIDGKKYDKLPNAFCMWENCPDKSIRIGERILRELKIQNIPLCLDEEITGEPNNGGVVWYPEGLKEGRYATTFEYFLSQNYTNHAFTTETISKWPLEMRINAHLTVLRTALAEKAKLLR